MSSSADPSVSPPTPPPVPGPPAVPRTPAAGSGAAAADADQSVRRVLLLLAAALAVVGIGGLVAVTVGRDGGSSGSDNGAVQQAAGVGPAPGAELAPYFAQRSAALAAAKGQRVAVVSFDGYRSEAAARAALGQLEVQSLLAAVPGGAPSVVTGPLAGWLDQQLASTRSDRDEIEKLLPTVDDPQFRDFYQSEIGRLTKLIDAAKPDGNLVFAAVVRGPATGLRSLSRGSGVRLVDVTGTSRLDPKVPVRGLRPEEKDRADDPPTRPA